MRKAYLYLEDGSVFTGRRLGADKDAVSEIVFNTSMAGYTEVLTDPSYAGQAVCMTYPMIGNYGLCREDFESGRPWMDALVVHEAADTPSNFRSDLSLREFMEEYELPGIEGIDTRKLVRHLRERGTMNGLITSREVTDLPAELERIRGYRVQKVVERVTCRETYLYSKASKDRTSLRIALLDLGMKENIARSLARRGCEVIVYPAASSAEEILGEGPDGIMLSNGPGDPAENVGIIRQVRLLYESGVPIFAICLGHQLMALATEARTEKLHYGHRGANHPVKDLTDGRVFITSQNHGYVVVEESVDPEIARPSFRNVNDRTNEGLQYLQRPVMTVQFHPEACSGPKDTGYLFDRFLAQVKEARDAKG